MLEQLLGLRLVLLLFQLQLEQVQWLLEERPRLLPQKQVLQLMLELLLLVKLQQLQR